jgi:ATP-binding cassette subfamily A (ABC1) protein 3
MVSIGIAMIPCVMVSFILIERSEGLKHMQLISGMNLLAYWISNLISDIVKVYIPCILMILTSIAFKVNYPYIWLLFLLLPLALVPFSYLTTFMFRDDTSGQIVTLSIHFFACAIMGLLVFTMQAIPQTFILGDKLRWICCVVPTYALINGILWSSSGS